MSVSLLFGHLSLDLGPTAINEDGHPISKPEFNDICKDSFSNKETFTGSEEQDLGILGPLPIIKLKSEFSASDL